MVTFHIDAEGGVAECRLAGQLDAYGAPMLREAMAAVSAFRAAVVDLSGVTFIDSAGLGVIANAVKRMRSAGSDIVLAAPRPAIARALDLAGMCRLVEVAATTEDAARVLAQPAAS